MNEHTDKAAELAHQLFDAARNGDADVIDAFVAAGAPVDMQDTQGNTMLMLASYHGQTAVVGVLISANADVNVVNDRGQSPLAGAVFKDESDVVSMLITAGADPDSGSPTARETAAMFGRSSLLDATS